jgi:predicted protein tyrosine phosphatase
MVEFTVCGYSEVKRVRKAFGATHILSLLDPGRTLRQYSNGACSQKLVPMEDNDSAGANSPTLEKVKDILAWGASLPKDSRVVVHCEAGVSRSTAAALGLWMQENPNASVADAVTWLLSVRKQARPNILIVQFLVDLGSDPRLLRECQELNSAWLMNMMHR